MQYKIAEQKFLTLFIYMYVGSISIRKCFATLAVKTKPI